jgi:hypothetical protein
MTISGGKNAGAAASGAILQTGQALLEKTLPPFADNLPGNSQLGPDLLVLNAFGREKDGFGSHHANIR